MLRRIGGLTVLNVALMLSNVTIQALLAAFLGAGGERDALFVAMSVPLFLNTLMVASLGTVATPTILAHKDPRKQQRAADRILGRVVLGSIVVAAALWGIRSLLVSLLAPGFDEAQRISTGHLFALTLPIIPLQGATSIIAGYWIAQERVFLPSGALLLGNVVTASVILRHGQGLAAMHVAAALLLTAGFVLLAQATPYFVRRYRLVSLRSEQPSKEPVRGQFRQSGLLMLLNAVSRSTPLVERRLASGLDRGTLSCLGYAGYLVSFLVNATTAPAATAYFATLLRQWNAGNQNEVKRFLERGLVLTFACSLAVAGLVLLLFGEAAKAVVPWTKFTVGKMDELIAYVRILMTAYVFLACNSFVSRIFYVSGRFIQAAVLDCASIAFYFAGALGLTPAYGGYGLAFALCVYSFGQAVLIYFAVRRTFDFHLSKTFHLQFALLGAVWGAAMLIGHLVKTLLAGKLNELSSAGLGVLFYLVVLCAGTLKGPLAGLLAGYRSRSDGPPDVREDDDRTTSLKS